VRLSASLKFGRINTQQETTQNCKERKIMSKSQDSKKGDKKKPAKTMKEKKQAKKDKKDQKGNTGILNS
jgi:hypothetical protein